MGSGALRPPSGPLPLMGLWGIWGGGDFVLENAEKRRPVDRPA